MNSASAYRARGATILIALSLVMASVGVVLPTSLSRATMSAALADNPPRKILSGWLPYYSTASGLNSITSNADLIQEVNPFWFTLKSATKISDLYTPANPNMPILVPIQVLQGLKIAIVPTITDGTAKGVLAGLIANANSRAQVVGTIANLVFTNNFDGIDLDLENFAFVDSTSTWPALKPNWIQFIKDLSLALHMLGKTLSVTTPVLFDPATGKQGYYVYAWADIASAIDRLRIMTYDYSTSSPGPIGPISWAEGAIKYAVSVVPASKVYLGIAGYGRDWVTKVDGSCPANVASVISAKGKAATFIMKDAISLASGYGVVPTYTPKFGESTFTYQKVYSGKTANGAATSCTATRTAWYQDPQGYAARANLVAKYRLGGLAAWTLGMEDPTASDAIRTVAKSIAPDLVVGSITSDDAVSTLGTPIKITGFFRLPDSRPIADLPVRLELKNSIDDWRTVYTASTDSDGLVSISVVLGEFTSIRMSSDSSWEHLAETTDSIDLAVSPLISWKPIASMKAGKSYTITGAVQPKVSGVQINLEGLLGTPVAQVVTDSEGRFSISVTPSVVGIQRIRLVSTDNQNLAPGNTDYFDLLVR